MCWKGGYPTTPMQGTPARNASAKSGFLSLFHIKFKKLISFKIKCDKRY